MVMLSVVQIKSGVKSEDGGCQFAQIQGDLGLTLRGW
jgi:hypothetical protein